MSELVRPHRCLLARVASPIPRPRGTIARVWWAPVHKALGDKSPEQEKAPHLATWIGSEDPICHSPDRGITFGNTPEVVVKVETWVGPRCRARSLVQSLAARVPPPCYGGALWLWGWRPPWWSQWGVGAGGHSPVLWGASPVFARPLGGFCWLLPLAGVSVGLALWLGSPLLRPGPHWVVPLPRMGVSPSKVDWPCGGAVPEAAACCGTVPIRSSACCCA